MLMDEPPPLTVTPYRGGIFGSRDTYVFRTMTGCPYLRGLFMHPLSVLPEYFWDSVRGIQTLPDFSEMKNH